MNETIKIDGKEFEVLTLDRIGEITHARLAGGKVMQAECVNELSEEPCVTIPTSNGEFYFDDVTELEVWGIQPLKLIERKPVEFVAWTAIVNFHGNDVVAIICPETVHIDTKFQCVEVNK